MSTFRRAVLPVAAMLTAFSWSVVAVRAGGLRTVLPFVAPTALLAIGTAWLTFAFAGKKFPELSALWSALVGGLAISPIVALVYVRNPGATIGSVVVLTLAIAAGAAMSGALLQIRRQVVAAFREWRQTRQQPSIVELPEGYRTQEVMLLHREGIAQK
jgi:hypothetical protein